MPTICAQLADALDGVHNVMPQLAIAMAGMESIPHIAGILKDGMGDPKDED